MPPRAVPGLVLPTAPRGLQGAPPLARLCLGSPQSSRLLVEEGGAGGSHGGPPRAPLLSPGAAWPRPAFSSCAFSACCSGADPPDPSTRACWGPWGPAGCREPPPLGGVAQKGPREQPQPVAPSSRPSTLGAAGEGGPATSGRGSHSTCVNRSWSGWAGHRSCWGTLVVAFHAANCCVSCEPWNGLRGGFPAHPDGPGRLCPFASLGLPAEHRGTRAVRGGPGGPSLLIVPPHSAAWGPPRASLVGGGGRRALHEFIRCLELAPHPCPALPGPAFHSPCAVWYLCSDLTG